MTEPIHGLGLKKLAIKLRKIKTALMMWNYVVFGQVDTTIKELETFLNDLGKNYKGDTIGKWMRNSWLPTMN